MTCFGGSDVAEPRSPASKAAKHHRLGLEGGAGHTFFASWTALAKRLLGVSTLAGLLVGCAGTGEEFAAISESVQAEFTDLYSGSIEVLNGNLSPDGEFSIDQVLVNGTGYITVDLHSEPGTRGSCGLTWLNSQYGITAAHCVDDVVLYDMPFWVHDEVSFIGPEPYGALLELFSIGLQANIQGNWALLTYQWVRRASEAVGRAPRA